MLEPLVNPRLFITKMLANAGKALKHVGFSFPFFSREASPLMSSESLWLLGTGFVCSNAKRGGREGEREHCRWRERTRLSSGAKLLGWETPVTVSDAATEGSEGGAVSYSHSAYRWLLTAGWSDWGPRRSHTAPREHMGKQNQSRTLIGRLQPPHPHAPLEKGPLCDWAHGCQACWLRGGRCWVSRGELASFCPWAHPLTKFSQLCAVSAAGVWEPQTPGLWLGV